jgi:hypothetical protein
VCDRKAVYERAMMSSLEGSGAGHRARRLRKSFQAAGLSTLRENAVHTLLLLCLLLIPFCIFNDAMLKFLY